MTEPSPSIDRKKIAMGLGLLTLVLIGTIVLLLTVDDTVARVVFIGVIGLSVFRIVSLVRWARRNRIE